MPVEGQATHASGHIGRSQFDIVHMINFYLGVLKGNTPENNARKITKSVAVILVAVRTARVEGEEEAKISIRGPVSYAGPGSLGGTESALRR